MATLAQVHALAEAVEPRWRAMILLATFTGLRLGELAGLTRRHVHLLHATVKVVQQVQELSDGSRVVVPPKTEAGRRTVAIPPHVLPDLEAHLGAWAEPGAAGLLFPAPEGGPIRRSNFTRRVWHPACQAVGIEGLRFHDLRHTGNMLAAATGASTRELMARMGHASPCAALIYQHASADRDRGHRPGALRPCRCPQAGGRAPPRRPAVAHHGCPTPPYTCVEMATEPPDQLRRSQPVQLSKEELGRRARPFEPLPGPLFDDLSDEEEEAFWNAVND